VWWHRCSASVNPGGEGLSGGLLLGAHTCGCPPAMLSSSTSSSFGHLLRVQPTGAHAWMSSSWKSKCLGEEQQGSLDCILEESGHDGRSDDQHDASSCNDTKPCGFVGSGVSPRDPKKATQRVKDDEQLLV